MIGLGVAVAEHEQFYLNDNNDTAWSQLSHIVESLITVILLSLVFYVEMVKHREESLLNSPNEGSPFGDWDFWYVELCVFVL